MNDFIWEYGTNTGLPLELRFGGTAEELNEAIYFLQKKIEVCYYEIMRGFRYRILETQIRHIKYYKGMKEVYGGLLKVCNEKSDRTGNLGSDFGL